MWLPALEELLVEDHGSFTSSCLIHTESTARGTWYRESNPLAHPHPVPSSIDEQPNLEARFRYIPPFSAEVRSGIVKLAISGTRLPKFR
jgi:hypothetical protein